MSQVAIDVIVKACHRICQQTVTHDQRNIAQALQEKGMIVSEQTKMAFTSMPDPFEGIDTAYLILISCAGTTLIMW